MHKRDIERENLSVKANQVTNARWSHIFICTVSHLIVSICSIKSDRLAGINTAAVDAYEFECVCVCITCGKLFFFNSISLFTSFSVQFHV